MKRDDNIGIEALKPNTILNVSNGFFKYLGWPSLVGVRRAKAAFSSGWKSHPATFAPAGSNRSIHGGNEVDEASDVKGH